MALSQYPIGIVFFRIFFALEKKNKNYLEA